MCVCVCVAADPAAVLDTEGSSQVGSVVLKQELALQVGQGQPQENCTALVVCEGAMYV